MNFFRRITATVSGSLEQAVAQIENHDAVVEAALKDTRRTAAKAKVRLTRVKRDGDELAKRLTALREAATQWEARAREIADSDEEKALTCMSRRNRCREEIARTETALAEHKTRQTELETAVREIEAKVREIETTRNLLRTRQSAADAKRSVSRMAVCDSYELDDVIERWEMNIVETELESPTAIHTDSLEADFLEQEERASLRADLDALLKQGDDS